MYNFSGSNSLVSPAGGTYPVRSFDLNSNSFTVGYAKLSVAMAPKPAGFQLDVGYGAVGAAINSNAPKLATGMPVSAVNGGTSPIVLENAFATATFGNLTLDLGKFTTWAGAEVIEANLNPNYSRSIMFFYIPLVHTGLRASYQVNSSLAVKLAVVNGWNDLGFEGDINSNKTFGFEIAYTAPDTTAITLNGYFGNETAPAPGSASGAGNTRSLVDLVGARSFGPLSLNLNIDYIHEKGNLFYDSTYIAGALMGKYTVNDNFAVAARAEYVAFGKPTGADKTPAAEEFTITGIVPMAGHLEIRAEIRGDFAQLPTGVPKDFNNGQDSSQFTGTLAFLSWF